MEQQTQTQPSNGHFTFDTILETSKRMGKELPIHLKYDPKIFWDSMGERYYLSFQKREQFIEGVPWLIDRMKVLNCETLLEVGCGFGRLLPFMLEAGVVKSAKGIDISTPIVKCSEDYLKPMDQVWCKCVKFQDGKWFDVQDNIPIADSCIACPKCGIQKPKKLDKPAPDFRDKIEVLEGDVRKLAFDSDSFDCVMSYQVLQHINTDDVESAVREMIRVSRKAILCVERFAFPGERFEPHVFSHNLSQIFRSMGVDVAQVSPLQGGLQGVVILKKHI